MNFLLILVWCFQILNSVVSVNFEKANEATESLSKKPFVPTSTMDGKIVGTASTSTALTQNTVKVISALQNMQNRLKQKEDDRLPKFDPDRQLHPNDKNDSIIVLRQILQLLGYLEKATESPFYDMELETAIKSFQANHCLDADGVIGEETKIRLNWSYAYRLKLIDDSISKLKSLVFTDRTIVVNIPTYTLYTFEQQIFKKRMKVIVGQPKRKTPTMTSYINAVEFNPVWVVPPTILFEDKIPKIIEDDKFLEKNNLKIFDNNDEEVDDPLTIDWDEASLHDFSYTLKQDAGPKNALGRIRFNLVNNQEIYLHDTPLPKLFKKGSRALSSGCIRLEKPAKLAAWALSKTLDEIKDTIDTEETTTKNLEQNITVHIVYAPVWVEDDGQVLWGDDPYKLNPQPQE